MTERESRGIIRGLSHTDNHPLFPVGAPVSRQSEELACHSDHGKVVSTDGPEHSRSCKAGGHDALRLFSVCSDHTQAKSGRSRGTRV